MYTIDINCDLGEGDKYDAAIMPLISSCNIACGGHYGDKATMSKAVRMAIKNKVNIGAHPSYPDKGNFGRKPYQMSLSQLKESIHIQIEQLDQIAQDAGGKLHHVKPHGALYNELMTDSDKAKAVIETIRAFNDKLVLFVPPESMIKRKAKGNLQIMTEGFADRNYEARFRLVSRSKKNALLTQKEDILKQVIFMVKNNSVYSSDGSILNAHFDTICLHSDTENCLENLHFLHKGLPKNDIEIKKHE